MTLRFVCTLILFLLLAIVPNVSAQQTTPAWRPDRAPCVSVHPWITEQLSAIPAKFRSLSPAEMRSFGYEPPTISKRWPHSGAAAQRIQGLLTSGCFEILDRSFEELNESLRYEQREEWIQADFAHALQWVKEPNRPELELVEEWKKQRPGSAFVFYVEAVHWYQTAWQVRGFGFANRVSAENFEIFRENLQKSSKTLLSNKQFIEKYPLFAVFNLAVQASDPDKFKSLHKDFLDARKRWPTYLPLYLVRGAVILPKWGGNLQAFHRFIKENASIAFPGTDKDSLARLYSAFSDQEAYEAATTYWAELRPSYDAWNVVPEPDKTKRRRMLEAYKSTACFVKDKEATSLAHHALVREKLLDTQYYKPELDGCLRLVSDRT